MPLGFVVVTWRRCGANARTDRQRTERRSSPCRRNASGSAISATDRDKGRRHGQFLRFMGAMTVSDRLNAHPIRHALAPLHPTRHPANMLMPIGLVVVAWRRCGANARTYGCRSTGVPRHGRTPGAALFRPRIADRRRYARCLRFADTVNAPDRQNANLTRRALAPARHIDQPVMPIG